MADNHEVLIERFCGVTGAEKERAIFYLQAAAWNLEAAMGTFYDGSAADEQLENNEEMPKSDFQVEPTSETKPSPYATGGKRGVATLSDYSNKQAAPRGKDGQQFFVGGSEHSGQLVEGPPKKKLTPESITQGFIDVAKKHGTVAVEEEREERHRETPAFHGTGFKLGDTEGPSQSMRANIAQPTQPERRRYVLTLWKDGFSIDSGPLRNGEAEEDRQFIESVRKGEVPEELRKDSGRSEVDVDIKDQRDQNYVKPKAKMVAFSGTGRALGSYTPELKSTSSSSATSLQVGVTATSGAIPTASVPIDPTYPTTSLQIRLADGSRLTAKFNHSHTVNDIRQFIDLSHPCSINYVLMTTFPNKELSDPTLTLSQANLLNAVIVQRTK